MPPHVTATVTKMRFVGSFFYTRVRIIEVEMKQISEPKIAYFLK